MYNPAAVEWLTNFFTQPYQQLDGALRQAARHGYQAMKRRTRQELMRNWEELLEGHLVSFVHEIILFIVFKHVKYNSRPVAFISRATEKPGNWN